MINKHTSFRRRHLVAAITLTGKKTGRTEEEDQGEGKQREA